VESWSIRGYSFRGRTFLGRFQIDVLEVVKIQSQRIPVFDTWIEQINSGVPIDTNHSWLTEEKPFRIVENIEALLRITSMRGLVYQLVISWIAPAGIIVAVPGSPDGQKRRWIHEIADPSAADHVIVHRILTLEVHFPFLILDADINVELLLPHLLNRFCDHPMSFVGVNQDIELREPLAIGVTGFSLAIAGLAPGHSELCQAAHNQSSLVVRYRFREAAWLW
jgi:hypothetical protein